ncbi:MAG TPA: hypothetical protein VMR14_15405 [Streptosporangiaceae bacterium]|jgi:hypothetical protein|nr:hypothetical protein [Streptosporangiaceae bacterium]
MGFGGRVVIAVGLLAAGVVAWAALPLGSAPAFATPVLAIACLCAVLSVIRLTMVTLAVGEYADAGARERGAALYDWPASQLWRWLIGLPGALPWAQVLIVAVLVLEAVHPARPWHTAMLALLLLGFLLAAHLAESGGGPLVFRPHLPFIVAGVALAWLAVGAAALPASAGGAGSGWLAAFAAVAAVVVAGLALPL